MYVVKDQILTPYTKFLIIHRYFEKTFNFLLNGHTIDITNITNKLHVKSHLCINYLILREDN